MRYQPSNTEKWLKIDVQNAISKLQKIRKNIHYHLFFQILAFFDAKHVYRLYIDACFLIFTIFWDVWYPNTMSKKSLFITLSTQKWNVNLVKLSPRYWLCSFFEVNIMWQLEIMFTSAYNDNCKVRRCWSFLKISTSLRMFITLFIFLSNPASCINIDLLRNKHRCFDQKNTNFDIGACLSMRGVKNEQNCLLCYLLLRWMCFTSILKLISVIQC